MIIEFGSRAEFESQVRLWRATYVVAPERDFSVWTHRCRQALQRLPYLSALTEVRQKDTRDTHFILRAQLKGVAKNAVAVKMDYRTVLKSGLTSRGKLIFALHTTSDGFEVHLGNLDEVNGYIVGVIKTVVPQ